MEEFSATEISLSAEGIAGSEKVLRCAPDCTLFSGVTWSI